MSIAFRVENAINNGNQHLALDGDDDYRLGTLTNNSPASFVNDGSVGKSRFAGTFGHFSVGIERRSVAGTIELTIRLCLELAFPVRAVGRQGHQLVALADQKESLVAETVVQPVGSRLADRSRVYHSLVVGDDGTTTVITPIQTGVGR